jgi:hypothetical protein
VIVIAGSIPTSASPLRCGQKRRDFSLEFVGVINYLLEIRSREMDTVYKDTKECIKWGHNVIGGRERAKYIYIRKYFAIVHEIIQNGNIRLVFVDAATAFLNLKTAFLNIFQGIWTDSSLQYSTWCGKCPWAISQAFIAEAGWRSVQILGRPNFSIYTYLIILEDSLLQRLQPNKWQRPQLPHNPRASPSNN